MCKNLKKKLVRVSQELPEEFELVQVLNVGKTNVMNDISFEAEEVFILPLLCGKLCF